MVGDYISEENPRVQCEMCGRWTRLLDADGNQLNFGFEGWLNDLPEVHYDALCYKCHLHFGVVIEPFKEVEPKAHTNKAALTGEGK